MAKIDELKKILNMLDSRIRPTVGDAAAHEQKGIQELRLGALPNPDFFPKQVEVIVLDASDDDEGVNTGKKGRTTISSNQSPSL